jgi:hypothetical protein
MRFACSFPKSVRVWSQIMQATGSGHSESW